MKGTRHLDVCLFVHIILQLIVISDNIIGVNNDQNCVWLKCLSLAYNTNDECWFRRAIYGMDRR